MIKKFIKDLYDPKILAIGLVDLGLPSGNLWLNHNMGTYNSKEIGKYYKYGEEIIDLKLKEIIDANYFSALSIPGENDWIELVENTISEWICSPIFTGRKFISKINKAYIYLPATGYCNIDRDYHAKNINECYYMMDFHLGSYDYVFLSSLHMPSEFVFLEDCYLTIRPIFKPQPW